MDYNQNKKLTMKQKIFKKIGLGGASIELTILILIQCYSILNYCLKLYKFNFKWRENFLLSIGGFIGPVVGTEGKNFTDIKDT